MKIKKVTNLLLKQYPLNLQEEWDQSGYVNRGNLNNEISKVYVCLDLNEVVIDQAIKNKVKLIVSHHPIFKEPGVKPLFHTQRILNKIKKHKITVLSLHTCFDNSDQGMNILIGTILKLENLGWYKKNKFVVGSLPKAMSVKQIADLFKLKFAVSLITTNAKVSDKFNKLAICAGAGLSVIEPCLSQLEKEKVLIVTGDIKHHGWQNLSHYKVKALDVGHDLENCFVEFMASLIKMNFKELEVTAIRTTKKEKVI